MVPQFSSYCHFKDDGEGKGTQVRCCAKVQLQLGSCPEEKVWSWWGKEGTHTTEDLAAPSLSNRATIIYTAYWLHKSLGKHQSPDLLFTSPLNVQGEKAKHKTDSLVLNNIFGQRLSNLEVTNFSESAKHRTFYFYSLCLGELLMRLQYVRQSEIIFTLTKLYAEIFDVS